MTESFYLSDLWKVGQKWIAIIEVKDKKELFGGWESENFLMRIIFSVRSSYKNSNKKGLSQAKILP